MGRRFSALFMTFVMVLTCCLVSVGAAVLQIDSAVVTEQSASGYRVTVTFTATAGVSRVLMPTWTEANGQDDIVWYQATVSQNTATCYIPVSRHNGELGTYITHIYVYDAQGQFALQGVSTVLASSSGSSAAPSISNVTASGVTSSGYRVTVNFSAPAGVSRVLMPTWTEANGQDDLVWHQAAVSGNTAFFDIPVSQHKGESGSYITHIYVYDSQNRYALEGVNVTVPSGSSSGTGSGTLSIGDISVTEVTSAGYRVTAQINAPAGIQKVEMPTWTEANGQDDLVWHQAAVSGNTASFYVPVSAHKNEAGKYITHIYLYDNAGNYVLKGTEAVLPAASSGGSSSGGSGVLSISDIRLSEVSSSGYRVTATVAASAGIARVQMATWSDANGQDDLVWQNADVSGNTATCYISASQHGNQTGAYTTHIYLYDVNGEKAIDGIAATVSNSSGSGAGSGTGVLSFVGVPYVTQLTSGGFQVTIKFNAPNGYNRISAAVWTSNNGQDDLVWHDMTVSGDMATVYIPASSHNGERGSYMVNVYIFESTSKYVMTGMIIPVP